MIIHVVQPGETIYSIASDYNVEVTRLVEDNAIINPENLVVGQAIAIAYPDQIYIAQEGDSLDSIATLFGVSRMQLLRNNPLLLDRGVIYQGETIVIRYATQGNVSVNAYAYPFINRGTLRKTLPYLTYLTIYNYITMEDGEISGNDDSEIIQIAKEYGVAPLMSLSTLNYQGVSNIEAANSILYNNEILEHHINVILTILEEKGYYGLNISLANLNQQDLPAYENFINRLASRLKAGGYRLFITVTPRIIISPNEIYFEQIDYTRLGELTDYLQILPYGWGSVAGPPSVTTSSHLTSRLLKNVVTMVPSEKLFTGISVIGYDWKTPYVIGITKANSLTNDAAIELAVLTGSTIMFDESSQAPYFEYYSPDAGVQNRHIVWFSDARSVNSFLKFVPEYGLQGIGIWNVMSYFAQMWLVINSQYTINKIWQEV